MPRPRGSRFGDVTSAHIVRAELARIELRWILSSSAHIVRAEVDFSELSSHRASRIRRAPAPADPESARYQAPDGPLDGSSAGIATTLRDASSATDIDRAAGELPVLPWAAFGSPRPFHHSPVRGLARPPGAPRDEPSSTTRTRSHPGTSRRPQGRTCLSPACVRAGAPPASPPARRCSLTRLRAGRRAGAGPHEGIPASHSPVRGPAGDPPGPLTATTAGPGATARPQNTASGRCRDHRRLTVPSRAPCASANW